MKLKHNKKRNTAFVYQVLINEYSKATMYDLHEKKQSALNILKTFFSKDTPLRKELEIYKSFDQLDNLDQGIIEKIISEAKNYALRLDHDNVYESQTKIINLINKHFGHQSWHSFVREYKKMATINQVVFCESNPKKQVFVEKKLIEILTTSKETEKEPFPNINNLALKSFLEKFNKEYSQALNENQKTLLNKYVTSYKDDGLELKIYLHEEVERLKTRLQESVDSDEAPALRLKLILEKINNYREKKVDRKLITEIIKIQSLVSEINNAS